MLLYSAPAPSSNSRRATHTPTPRMRENTKARGLAEFDQLAKRTVSWTLRARTERGKRERQKCRRDWTMENSNAKRCSPVSNRLELVGEVLATSRRGVKITFNHHRQATEKQKAHHDEQNIEWSWSSETVCGSVAIACSPTNDAVTVLALHGRRHAGDACGNERSV